ncbi:MAG: hypothetical protein K2Y02_08055, partial [Burkholderiaceae bacterium]|nr:hypothetical protein [Burkholderiaceae bacterium]
MNSPAHISASASRAAPGASVDKPTLARLLDHTADAIEAVRSGRSLTGALARCPADVRPGVHALSCHVMRRL